MPARRAFRTGRVIAVDGFARIAKAHGKNGDLARVVELLPRQINPVAQPVSVRSVPGNAGFVDLSAGRLSNNAQPRRSVCLHDRTRSAGRGISAVRARADIPKQLRQGFVYFPRGKTA